MSEALQKKIEQLTRDLAEARAQERERCAKFVECHADDRGGRMRNVDWHDGYIDGCKGAAAVLRSLPDNSGGEG